MAELIIGPRRFAAKKAAISAIQSILHSTPLETHLDGEDLSFIRDVFSMHQDVEAKSEGGVKAFGVHIVEFNGRKNRGFYVEHDDGSRTNWSFTVALGPRIEGRSLAKAGREAIVNSLRAAKEPYFNDRYVAPCQHCGRPIMRDEAHVHHEHPLPYRKIVELYVAQFGMPKLGAGQVWGDGFLDPAEERAFVEYHDSVARLSVVCPTCNGVAERGTRSCAA